MELNSSHSTRGLFDGKSSNRGCTPPSAGMRGLVALLIVIQFALARKWLNICRSACARSLSLAMEGHWLLGALSEQVRPSAWNYRLPRNSVERPLPANWKFVGEFLLKASTLLVNDAFGCAQIDARHGQHSQMPLLSG
jgi:hypothetical protein